MLMLQKSFTKAPPGAIIIANAGACSFDLIQQLLLGLSHGSHESSPGTDDWYTAKPFALWSDCESRKQVLCVEGA